MSMVDGQRDGTSPQRSEVKDLATERRERADVRARVPAEIPPAPPPQPEELELTEVDKAWFLSAIGSMEPDDSSRSDLSSDVEEEAQRLAKLQEEADQAFTRRLLSVSQRREDARKRELLRQATEDIFPPPPPAPQLEDLVPAIAVLEEAPSSSDPNTQTGESRQVSFSIDSAATGNEGAPAEKDGEADKDEGVPDLPEKAPISHPSSARSRAESAQRKGKKKSQASSHLTPTEKRPPSAKPARDRAPSVMKSKKSEK
ncbi:hypothetical protein HDU96_004834 [Phlyctochytrium bullatum]|nr:hypothetical protein HDU96_004834 [Phlyctochytrium bullatum]